MSLVGNDGVSSGSVSVDAVDGTLGGGAGVSGTGVTGEGGTGGMWGVSGLWLSKRMYSPSSYGLDNSRASSMWYWAVSNLLFSRCCSMQSARFTKSFLLGRLSLRAQLLLPKICFFSAARSGSLHSIVRFVITRSFDLGSWRGGRTAEPVCVRISYSRAMSVDGVARTRV